MSLIALSSYEIHIYGHCTLICAHELIGIYGIYVAFEEHICWWHIYGYTGGSRLSWIFWEHENQSGLLVIWLIYIKFYRKEETKFWKKKSGLSRNPA